VEAFPPPQPDMLISKLLIEDAWDEAALRIILPAVQWSRCRRTEPSDAGTANPRKLGARRWCESITMKE
jgi:hypothetical protein